MKFFFFFNFHIKKDIYRCSEDAFFTKSSQMPASIIPNQGK